MCCSSWSVVDAGMSRPFLFPTARQNLTPVQCHRGRMSSNAHQLLRRDASPSSNSYCSLDQAHQSSAPQASSPIPKS